MLFSGSGCLLFSSTGTICGTPSTTVTGTLTVVVFSWPSTVYLTVTSTSVSSVKSGTVIVAVSSIATVAPWGNFPVNVPSAIAFFAWASTFSFAFSLSPFLGTRISSASGFGKTVTGTFTVSVNLPLSYVTGTSTVISVAPALPAVSGKVVGAPFVPSVPAVTAVLACSAVGVSPSNTTTLLGVELTTVTGTLIVSSATTVPVLSLYWTFTGTVSLSPLESVAGTVYVWFGSNSAVTPDGNVSLPTAACAFSFTAVFKLSLVVSFNVVTFSGVAFGNTSTGTFTVSSRFLSPEP